MNIAHLEQLQKTGKIRGYKVSGGKPVEAVKESKYRNSRVTYDGIKFQSIREGKRYLQLMRMQQMGFIRFLNLQVPFQLPSCKYFADFVYFFDGEVVIEDAKGKKTDMYILKKKMMFELGHIIKEV